MTLPADRYVPPVAVAIIAMLLAAIWLTPAPPFQDAVEWVWQGHLTALLLGQVAPVPEALAIKTWPVPNALVQAYLTLGAFLGTPLLALRLLLTTMLGLCLALAAAAASRAGPARAPSVFLIVLCLGLGTAFFNGYLNYVLGALAVAAFALHLGDGRTVRPACTALLAVVIFFTHAFALAAFSVLVAAYAVMGRLRWSHLAALVPAYALFGWYLIEDEASDRATRTWSFEIPDLATQAKFLAYKAYTFAKHGSYHNFVIDGASDRHRLPELFWAGVAGNLIWALFAGILLLLFLWRAQRRPEARPLALALAALLVPFLLLPQRMADIINPGERFLTMALLIIFAAGSRLLPPLGLRLTAVASSLLVVSLVSLLVLVLPRQDVPRSTLQNQAADIGILFSHAPDRFHARVRAMSAEIMPEQDDLLAFQTGLLYLR